VAFHQLCFLYSHVSHLNTHTHITYPSGAVDLGAMWIHEATPANPLYQLAKDSLNITLSPVVQYNAGQLFGPDGKSINAAFYAVSAAASTEALAG